MLRIITGCGRSGTNTVTHLLRTKAGLEIGHEKWRKHGVVSWEYAADPRIASPKKARPIRALTEDKIVIHIVRKPLNCINSVRCFSPISWQYIEKHIPVNHDDDLTLKAMKYWFYWNKLAAGRSVFTFQIEQIKKNWTEIMKVFKIKKYKFLSEVPILSKKTYETRLTWKDLRRTDKSLMKEIIKLGRRYGYEI